MGRHRSDPRGLARILIAAVAVVLALGLLVIGAIALWGALSAEGTGPPGETGTARTAGSRVPSTSRAPDRSAAETLLIRVTGQQAKVFVSIPGPNPEVLYNNVLPQGEELRYGEPRLNVVVYDAGAVQVVINGKVKPKGEPGQRKEYTINND